MTQPDLVALAKQGDVGAIATLLSRALPAHLHIQVKLKQGYLQVILTAPPKGRIDRSKTVMHVRQVLISLAAPIQTVKIYGLQLGQPTPVWTEAFSLKAGSAMQYEGQLAGQLTELSNPQTRRRRSSSGIPRWLSEKPDPSAWLALLQTHFEPLKLLGLLPIILYGIFGSSAYTVDNFLDGGNGIMMFLHGVNLIFHEAGHTFFAPFGEFLHILGGSLNQILVPALISAYFFVTRQGYAGAIAAAWAAENFWDVSIYIKDAQERTLPLLGGEGVLHDWHFLLLDLHLLAQDQIVGTLVYGIGSLLYIIAIGLGIYYARRV